MFWLVAAGVVVVLGALAWWTSGRSKPLGRNQFSATSQAGGQHGKAESEVRAGYDHGPTAGGGATAGG
jgi:hypothetical protein